MGHRGNPQGVLGVPIGPLWGTGGVPWGPADLPPARGHYTEYLVRLINEHRLDPARLYTPAELRAAAERHLPAGRPPRASHETDDEYATRLRRLLAREAPLGTRPPRR